MPGRWRSGIHSSSTATPVTAVTSPKLSGRCACQALVEDVPRVEAQRRADLHRHARAVEHEPAQQLRDAAGGGGGDGQGTQVDGGHEIHPRRSGLKDQGQFDAAVARCRGRWCVRFRRSAVRGAGAGSGGATCAGWPQSRRWCSGCWRSEARRPRPRPRSGSTATSPTRRERWDPTRPRVQAALDRLSTETGMRLYVVYVDSFSGRGRPGLGGPVRPGVAARPARRAAGGRDRRPCLRHLARRRRSRCPTTVVDGHRDPGRPPAADRERLGGRGRRAGRRAAHRPGRGRLGRRLAVAARCPSGSSSAGSRWSAAGPTLLARRRRRAAREGATRRPRRRPRRSPTRRPARRTDDLAYHASSALIELDDAVQTSEHELGLARTQFGDEAVHDFRAALEQSRAELVQAFALRQRIDDEKPDEPTRRDLLSQILHLSGTADQRLDAQSAAFDRLRDLEQNLPSVLAGPEAEAERHGRAGSPVTTAALDALRARYAESALEPVADNIPQATARLDVAAHRDRRGRAPSWPPTSAPAAAVSGAGRGGGDRAGRHAARRGARGSPTSWRRPRTGWSRPGPRSRPTWRRPSLLPGERARRRGGAGRGGADRGGPRWVAPTSRGGTRSAALRRLDEAGTALDQALSEQRTRSGGGRAGRGPAGPGPCSRHARGSRRRRTSSPRAAAPSAATPAPGWQRPSGT